MEVLIQVKVISDNDFENEKTFTFCETEIDNNCPFEIQDNIEFQMKLNLKEISQIIALDIIKHQVVNYENEAIPEKFERFFSQEELDIINLKDNNG